MKHWYMYVTALLLQIENVGTGDDVARVEPTSLPYNSSLCPANYSGTIFPCPALNENAAGTVHELKPIDVKV